MSSHLVRIGTPLVAAAAGAVLAASFGIASAGPRSAPATVNPVLVRASTTVRAGVGGSQYADCPHGDVAISGGAGWSGNDAVAGEVLTASGPVNHTDVFDTTRSGSKPLDWYASFFNGTTDNAKAYVWVECVAS